MVKPLVEHTVPNGYGVSVLLGLRRSHAVVLFTTIIIRPGRVSMSPRPPSGRSLALARDGSMLGHVHRKYRNNSAKPGTSRHLYRLCPVDRQTHSHTHTHTHTHTYESSFISWLSVLAIFLGGAGLSPSPCSCSRFLAAFC